MPRRVSLLELGTFFLQCFNYFLGNHSNWTPSNLCQHIDMTNGGCWTIPWQTLGSIGPDSGEYSINLPDAYSFKVLSSYQPQLIGWVCSMFVEPNNCVYSSGNLNSGGIYTPGVADLTTWNDGFTGKWNGYWFTDAKTIQCEYA